jgi:DNA-binding response OmpR family regulator
MSIILIIDDEQPKFASAKAVFAAHGHIAHTRSGPIRPQDIALSRADVVLLNLSRTEPEEESALCEVRGFSDVPVVVASSHGAERTVTGLLNLGADDYLVKPFSFSHAIARIDAVLRRIPAAPPVMDFVEIGDLRVDFRARSIVQAGKALVLTPTEFDLLALLAKYLNTVVSREDAIKALWSRADPSAYQVLRVHVSSLRRKLGDSATSPRYLHTLHGVGLKLTSASAPLSAPMIDVNHFSRHAADTVE